MSSQVLDICGHRDTAPTLGSSLLRRYFLRYSQLSLPYRLLNLLLLFSTLQLRLRILTFCFYLDYKIEELFLILLLFFMFIIYSHKGFNCLYISREGGGVRMTQVPM